MDDSDDVEGLAKLHAIAALLDIPVGNFYIDREAKGHFDETGECLRLWGRIRTADGRRRALACLRDLADGPAT